MERFDKELKSYIRDIEVGQYDNNGVNIGFKNSRDVVKDFISQALTNQATEIGKEMEKEITGEMYVGGGLVRLDVVLSIINKYKGTHD